MQYNSALEPRNGEWNVTLSHLSLVYKKKKKNTPPPPPNTLNYSGLNRTEHS